MRQGRPPLQGICRTARGCRRYGAFLHPVSPLSRRLDRPPRRKSARQARRCRRGSRGWPRPDLAHVDAGRARRPRVARGGGDGREAPSVQPRTGPGNPLLPVITYPRTPVSTSRTSFWTISASAVTSRDSASWRVASRSVERARMRITKAAATRIASRRSRRSAGSGGTCLLYRGRLTARPAGFRASPSARRDRTAWGENRLLPPRRCPRASRSTR